MVSRNSPASVGHTLPRAGSSMLHITLLQTACCRAAAQELKALRLNGARLPARVDLHQPALRDPGSRGGFTCVLAGCWLHFNMDACWWKPSSLFEERAAVTAFPVAQPWHAPLALPCLQGATTPKPSC